MMVFYFFQGELGESMACPNAFTVSDHDLTFGEFLKHFPLLDKGNMHFRFKSDDESFGYVWEDIREVTRTLPIYQGNVFAKILRLGDAAAEKRKIVLKRKCFEPTMPVFQSIQKQSAPTPIPPPRKLDNPRNDNASPAPRADKSPVISSRAESSSAKANPEPNFFDSNGPSTKQQFSPPPDIISFDEPSVSPSSSAKIRSNPRSQGTVNSAAMDIDDDRPSSSVGGGELNRAELAAKKEEAIEDKVRSALEFKKEVDQRKEREQVEFDSAKAKHEVALNSWASNNKEKRNVRTLLSTMHTVLPSDSKWKALGLGDVLEPNQVKKAYRKAMLVVHPDHCINLDSEHKFICKRVFEALNEAYEEFTKKENV